MHEMEALKASAELAKQQQKKSNKISSILGHPPIIHHLLLRTIINKWFGYVILLEFELDEHKNLCFQLVRSSIENWKGQSAMTPL